MPAYSFYKTDNLLLAIVGAIIDRPAAHLADLHWCAVNTEDFTARAVNNRPYIRAITAAETFDESTHYTKYKKLKNEMNEAKQQKCCGKEIIHDCNPLLLLVNCQS